MGSEMRIGEASEDRPRSEEDMRFELAAARTILCWNECEVHLIFYLQALLGVDQFRARVIWTSLPTFDARRKLLVRLSETFTPKDTHASFQKLLNRCSKMSQNRNRLAHGFGGYSPDKKKVMFFGDTKDSEIGTDFLNFKTYDLTNIEGWPRAIRDLIKDLMEYLEQYSDQVSASSRMHVQYPHR